MNNKLQKNGIKRAGTNPYLWLFLITSLLFGILFIRFILGDYAYFYVDMGADTFDINYPMYQLFSDVFHGKGYEHYFLNVGLGMDMSSYLFQYLNPLNLLIVLIPKHLIPWGVLLIAYLKLLIISMFGYKLFEKWIQNVWGSLAAALLWTFSSYVMLWGQHYGFCTSVALFTVFLYLVHLFAEDEEKSRNWLLVLWITLMLFTNYYFLYMSGVMGALYVTVYLIFRKKSWKKILAKLLGLAGMGLLGICIGGVCLVPVLNIFQGSTRASAVNAKHLSSMLKPYKAKWLYAFLARLISNNTLGIADKYTGAGNYYEVAMLFTSSLFFIGWPCLLTKKELRLKTLGLTAVSVLMLIFPVTGKIFTMNTGTQRWSFLLCLMEAFAVGMAVKVILTEKNKRSACVSVAAGVMLTGGVYGLLFFGQSQKYFKIKEKYLVIFGAFLAVYGILILMKTFLAKMERVFPILLISVICAELASANYPTINDRKNPTRNQVAVEYYNDGTAEAYQALKEKDDSLYRVSKTYESASENDSMVQGYAGFSTYMTTNPKELIALKEMYGGTGISANFVSFGNDNYLLNTLLGMKYLLAKPENLVSGQNFSLVELTEGRDIYENRYALPFGYLYDQEWDIEEIRELPVMERTLSALYGFYFTEESGKTKYAPADRTEQEEISLMDRKIEAVDCKAEKTPEGIRMSEMTEDPHILISNVGDAFGEGAVHTITIEADAAEKADMALYYKTEGVENFSQDQIYIFDISPKKSSWTYTIPGDVTDLRIDVSTEISEVTIRNVTGSNCEADNEAFYKLRNSEVSEISYTGNTYEAAVENSSEGTKMLCVPFLYHTGWKAEVDGEETALYNINSGLCGVEIPSGNHRVTLHYEIPHEQIGIGLTLCGLVVYAVWLLAGVRKKSLTQ